MFRAEPEGDDEAGQEQEGKPTKVRAKPRDQYSELEDEIYSLKDRLNRLEAQKTQKLGERPADKNVGTAFPEELIDRLNKTLEDYQKAGLKLYKRKLLESGLTEALDDLNSTWQLDDAFKKSRGDAEKFVGYLQETSEEAGETETEKTWIWTSERSKHALALFRGRPDEIEKVLTLEPQLRQFLDFQAIERAKRAPKPKGAESGDDIFGWLFGEDEGEGEPEEEGGEEEFP